MWVQIAPKQRGNFYGKGHALACPTTLCRDLCKNGRTYGDAVWVADSGGPADACVKWGAHWRHLANMTELSMFGGPAKTAQPIEMLFVLWTWVGPKSMH